MLIFLWTIQIISALLLIVLVLIHSPKGDGIASIGGMAQAFSSQKNAESGLNKLTMWVAIVFFITTFLTGFKIAAFCEHFVALSRCSAGRCDRGNEFLRGMPCFKNHFCRSESGLGGKRERGFIVQAQFFAGSCDLFDYVIIKSRPRA